MQAYNIHAYSMRASCMQHLDACEVNKNTKELLMKMHENVWLRVCIKYAYPIIQTQRDKR